MYEFRGNVVPNGVIQTTVRVVINELCVSPLLSDKDDQVDPKVWYVGYQAKRQENDVAALILFRQITSDE